MNNSYFIRFLNNGNVLVKSNTSQIVEIFPTMEMAIDFIKQEQESNIFGDLGDSNERNKG